MYAKVRTDNMAGTINPEHLVSAKFYDASDAATAIENGNIVTIGDFLDGEREIRKATAPTAATTLRNLYVVATPEAIKDKDYYSLTDFINKADTPIRCYRLTPGASFSVSKEALDGTPAKGSIVEAQDGTKMKVVTDATSGSTTIGTIMRVEGDYYVIEIA